MNLARHLESALIAEAPWQPGRIPSAPAWRPIDGKLDARPAKHGRCGRNYMRLHATVLAHQIPQVVVVEIRPEARVASRICSGGRCRHWERRGAEPGSFATAARTSKWSPSASSPRRTPTDLAGTVLKAFAAVQTQPSTGYVSRFISGATWNGRLLKRPCDDRAPINAVTTIYSPHYVNFITTLNDVTPSRSHWTIQSSDVRRAQKMTRCRRRRSLACTVVVRRGR